MLVLMRRVGEDIFLTVNDSDGNKHNIRVTVSKISGKQVTLGIEAKNNVKILRNELLESTETISNMKLDIDPYLNKDRLQP